MENKDFEIGEVFQYGLAKLRCDKAVIKDRCLQCSLYDDLDYVCRGKYVGECDKKYREDNTDVIFKLVEA